MKISGSSSWVAFCPALALGVLACGDGSDDGANSCQAFVACGGDPSGTWQSQTACLPDDVVEALVMALPAECRSGVTVDEATASTTLTIGDGSISEEGSITVEWAMDFRKDCIGAAVPGQTVDANVISAFCSSFADTLSGPSTPFTASSCTTLDDGCSCSARQATPVNQSSAYTLDGSALVSPDGQRQGFCVNGDELDLNGVEGMASDGAHIIYTRVE